MNYVVAAWLAVGSLLAAYAGRALRRERALRRALAAGHTQAGRTGPVGGDRGVGDAAGGDAVAGEAVAGPWR